MSSVSLRLPDSLHRRAQRVAEEDGVSLNQLIVTALAEKLSAQETSDYLTERAQHGDRAAFESALSRVSSTREPVAGDRIKEAAAGYHTWSEDDELIAYGLYRLGAEALGMEIEMLADVLGMGTNSLNLKIANFKALDGKGGLSGWSRQAERVFEEHRGLTDAELRNVVLGTMADALNR